MPVFFNMKNCL